MAKRHFRKIGVCESKENHREGDACFEFVSNRERIFLHFDSRGDLSYLAQQIRDLFKKDLELAQRRTELFK